MINKKKKFYSITAILIMVRLIDIVSTYLLTPNLEGEMNPVAHFGWFPLIVSNIVFTIILIYFLYHYYFRYKISLQNDVELASTREYISFCYFGNKNITLIKYLTKNPSNWKPIIAHLSIAIPVAFIIFGIYVVLNNLFILFEIKYYMEFMSKYHLYQHYASFAVFIFVLVYLFQINKEFKNKDRF